MASSPRTNPRVPVALLVSVVGSMACSVYDPSLLTRRDAGFDVPVEPARDLGAASDLAADRPRDVAADLPPPVDTPTLTDAPSDALSDGPHDAAADAPDAAADAGRDVPDVPDVPVDVPPSCAATLAMGAACLEPVTGHRWTPDEPRLVAPGALALTADRLYVSDVGSARVMAYDLGSAPLEPARLVGTGLVGASTLGGLARVTPINHVASMALLPGGTVLFADREAHQLLRLRDGRLEPLGLALSFPSGPFAVAYAPDTNELFVAGDNRIHVVSLDADGGVGAASTVVGQTCGGSCPGFNGDGLAGTATALGFPVSLDVDTTYVYFADRDNCRIRRFRRDDPTRRVDTFAGSTCNLAGDPLGESATGFVPRGMLQLGRVGDVRYGADGSIYFVDESHCAVFQVVASALTTARIVLGSRNGCGQPTGVGGIALGRVGGIAMSADRSALYVSDTQLQRVLRVDNTAGGGTPRVVIAQSPGATPRANEDAAGLRPGHPTSLAALGDGATLLVSGAAEGRMYRVDMARSRIVLGDGASAPAPMADGFAATTLPRSVVTGLAGDGVRAVFGLPDRGVIADLSGFGDVPTVRRVAGRFADEVLDAGVPRDVGPDATVVAAAGSFVRPAWPFTQGGVTWFSDAAARVWRVSTTGVAEPFAGSGSGTATVPAGGTIVATAAPFGSAVSFALDRGAVLYVADPQRYVVWSVAAGLARVVAGVLDRPGPLGDDPNAAIAVGLGRPTALAYDGADTLFIADASANRVRALTVSTGRMTTVAGSGPSSGATPSTSGDYGPARMATLAQPTALAWSRGRLFVAEGASGRVRVLTLP